MCTLKKQIEKRKILLTKSASSCFVESGYLFAITHTSAEDSSLSSDEAKSVCYKRIMALNLLTSILHVNICPHLNRFTHWVCCLFVLALLNFNPFLLRGGCLNINNHNITRRISIVDLCLSWKSLFRFILIKNISPWVSLPVVKLFFSVFHHKYVKYLKFVCHNVAVMVIIFILTSADNSFSLLFLFLMFSLNHLLDCVDFLSGAGKLMLKESLSHLHQGIFRVVTKKDRASMLVEDTYVRNTMWCVRQCRQHFSWWWYNGRKFLSHQKLFPKDNVSCGSSPLSIY